MSSIAQPGLGKSGKPVHEIPTKVVPAKKKQIRYREFFSPYTSDSKFAMVKMMGANYKFRIIGSNGEGFGVFQPVDPTCARFVREANPVQYQLYLSLLPKAYFILVCPTDLGWCAFPFDAPAVKAQLGVGQEIVIRNVFSAERFDVVAARYDGMRFWYDGSFAGADLIKASALRDCFARRRDAPKMRRQLAKISGLVPEERKSFDIALSARQMATSAKERVIRGRNIEISWQAQSGTIRDSLNQFDVVSVGICLNNENEFYVKDLPGMVEGIDVDN